MRVTVSLPDEQYEMLERIAVDKKVSLSWVMREAVGHYLEERWPLLSQRR